MTTAIPSTRTAPPVSDREETARRLLADAGLFMGQSAEGISDGLLAKVRAFANGAPQSDDIAILTFKVDGRTAAVSGKDGSP